MNKLARHSFILLILIFMAILGSSFVFGSGCCYRLFSCEDQFSGTEEDCETPPAPEEPGIYNETCGNIPECDIICCCDGITAYPGYQRGACENSGFTVRSVLSGVTCSDTCATDVNACEAAGKVCADGCSGAHYTTLDYACPTTEPYCCQSAAAGYVGCCESTQTCTGSALGYTYASCNALYPDKKPCNNYCGVINYGNVTGYVYNFSTDNKISGAKVWIELSSAPNVEINSMYTNALGQYKFTGLEVGKDYKVFADKEGFVKNYESVSLTLPVELTKNINLTSLDLTDCVSGNPPSPYAAASHVKGKKEVRLDWGIKCPNVQEFIIQRTPAFAPVEKRTNKLFFIDTDVDWSQSYTYSIRARYTTGVFSNWASVSITLGNILCEDIFGDEEFCLNEALEKSDVNIYRYGCNGNNTHYNKLPLDTPSCRDFLNSPDAVCIGPDENDITKCVSRPTNCLEVDPFRPFGLYYDEATCLLHEDNLIEADVLNWCYYDSSSTTIDMCDNCLGQTCYDYKSEGACLQDNCGAGGVYAGTEGNSGCEWTDLWEEFGVGLCYDPDYSEADKCSLCGEDQGLFFNTACDEDFCSALGACYYNSTECVSCDFEGEDRTKCADYKTQEACVGSNNQPIDFEVCGTTNIPNNIIPSNDVCGVGVCKWSSASSRCYKDGNDDGVSECTLGILPCEIDSEAPVTRAPSYVPAMNASAGDLSFVSDSDAVNFYWCVGGENCCPWKPETYSGSPKHVVINPISPGSMTPAYSGAGVYYIRYYSVDSHSNVEEVQTLPFYFDRDVPIVSVDYSSQRQGDMLSSLTIILSSEEFINCSYQISPSVLAANIVSDDFNLTEKRQTFEVVFQDIPANLYAFEPSCKDDVGNTYSEIWNLFSPFNITIYKNDAEVDEIGVGEYKLQVKILNGILFNSLSVKYNYSSNLGNVVMAHPQNLIWEGNFTILPNDNTIDAVFRINVTGLDNQGRVSSIIDTHYRINTIGPDIDFEPDTIGPSSVYDNNYVVKGYTDPSSTVVALVFNCSDSSHCSFNSSPSTTAWMEQSPVYLINVSVVQCSTGWPQAGSTEVCFDGDLTGPFDPITEDYYIDFGLLHTKRYKVEYIRKEGWYIYTTTYFGINPSLERALLSSDRASLYDYRFRPGWFNITLGVKEGLNKFLLYAESQGKVGQVRQHFVNYLVDRIAPTIDEIKLFENGVTDKTDSKEIEYGRNAVIKTKVNDFDGGTVSDLIPASGVKEVWLCIDSKPCLKDFYDNTTDTAGYYQFNLTGLNEGAHTVYFYALDNKTNLNDSVGYTFNVVDTVPGPEIDFEPDTIGPSIVFDNNYVVKGYTKPGSVVNMIVYSCTSGSICVDETDRLSIVSEDYLSPVHLINKSVVQCGPQYPGIGDSFVCFAGDLSQSPYSFDPNLPNSPTYYIEFTPSHGKRYEVISSILSGSKTIVEISSGLLFPLSGVYNASVYTREYPSGWFSLTSNNLNEGYNYFEFYAQKEGKTGAIRDHFVNYLVDRIAPTIDEIKLFENGVTDKTDSKEIEYGRNAVIKARVNDFDGGTVIDLIPASGVKEVWLCIDSKPCLKDFYDNTTDANGYYQFNLSALGRGAHTVYFYALDNETNLNDSVEYTFNVVDTVGPDIYVVYPENNATGEQTTLLNFSTSEEARCDLYLFGATAPSMQETGFKKGHPFQGIGLNPPQGLAQEQITSFNVSCVDTLGNFNSIKVDITYSRTWPHIVNIYQSRLTSPITSFYNIDRITSLEVVTDINTRCAYSGGLSSDPDNVPPTDFNLMTLMDDRIITTHSRDLTPDLIQIPNFAENKDYTYYVLCRYISPPYRVSDLGQVDFTVNVGFGFVGVGSPQGKINYSEVTLNVNTTLYSRCQYKLPSETAWIFFKNEATQLKVEHKNTSRMNDGIYAYNIRCTPDTSFTSNVISTDLLFTVNTKGKPIAPIMWGLDENDRFADVGVDTINLVGYVNDTGLEIRSAAIKGQDSKPAQPVTSQQASNFKNLVGILPSLEPGGGYAKGVTVVRISDSDASKISSSDYIEFANHNSTNFIRYGVLSVTDIQEEWGPTNVNFNPPLSKDVPSGTVIRIYDGEKPTGWFEVNVPLFEGENRVEIYAKNFAGEPGEHKITYTYYDSQPPVISNFKLDNEVSDIAIFSDGVISADLSDHSIIKNVSMYINSTGQMVLKHNETFDKTSGTFSYTYGPLKNGTYIANITAVDKFGRKNHSTFLFRVDTSLPDAPTFNLDGGKTNSDSPTLEFTYEQGVSVVWLHGVPYVSNSTTDSKTYTFVTSGLTDGVYDISIGAKSIAEGGVRATNFSFIVDLTDPTIDITSSFPAVVGTQYIDIDGTCGDNYGGELDIIIRNETSTIWDTNCSDSGTFSFADIPLADGMNTLTVEITDDAGNVAEDSLVIELDRGFPLVQITNILNNNHISYTNNNELYRTNDSSLTIVGTYEDNNFDHIEVQRNGVTITPSRLTTGSPFQADITLVGVNGVETLNNIKIIGIDQTGLTDSDEVNVTYDLGGPQIVHIVPETYTTANLWPMIELTLNEKTNLCYINYTSSVGPKSEQFIKDTDTHFTLQLGFVLDNTPNAVKTQYIKIYCEDQFLNPIVHTIPFTVDLSPVTITDFSLGHGLGSIMLYSTADVETYVITQFAALGGTATDIQLNAITNKDTRCTYSGSLSGQFVNYGSYTTTHSAYGIPIYNNSQYEYLLVCQDKAGAFTPVKTIRVIANTSFEAGLPNININEVLINGNLLTTTPYRTDQNKVTIRGDFRDEAGLGINVLRNNVLLTNIDKSIITTGPASGQFEVNITLLGNSNQETINNITLKIGDGSFAKAWVVVIKDLLGPQIEHIVPETNTTADNTPTIEITLNEPAQECRINYTAWFTGENTEENFVGFGDAHFTVTLSQPMDYTPNGVKLQNIKIYCKDMFSNPAVHTVSFTIDDTIAAVTDFSIYHSPGFLLLSDGESTREYAITKFTGQINPSTYIKLLVNTNKDTRCTYSGSSSGQFKNYNTYIKQHETNPIQIFNNTDYTYNIVCEDKSGLQTGIKTIKIQADSTYEAGKPTITPLKPTYVEIPANAPTINSLDIWFNGTIEAPLGYSIQYGSLLINGAVSQTQPIPLASGGNYGVLVHFNSDGMYEYYLFANASNNKKENKTGYLKIDTSQLDVGIIIE